MASAQLQALAGKPCQLANSVTVMAAVPRDLGAPLTPETRTGDFALTAPGNGAVRPRPGAPARPGALGSGPDDVARRRRRPDRRGHRPRDRGGTGLGTLTTGWYPLPPAVAGDPTPATNVVVPVAGNDPDKQRLVLEFGYGPAAAPTRTVATTVNPASGLTSRQWQEVPVLLPADRPSSVRIVAEDRVAGPDTALAVAPPHLAAMQPVQTLTGPDSTSTVPVFADQLSAVLWPCVDQVAVRHGIAPTPQVRLSAAENTPGLHPRPTRPTSRGAARWSSPSGRGPRCASSPGSPPAGPRRCSGATSTGSSTTTRSTATT